MKKSFLALMCMATLVACKKNETTATETYTDSTEIVNDSDTLLTSDSLVVGDSSVDLSSSDKSFAEDAARGSLLEVTLGKLAVEKGSNAQVKAFGEMMSKDHSKASDELKSWAASVGYNLPVALNNNEQRKHDDLKAKSGAEFDREYMDLMVEHHKETVNKFEKTSSNGDNAQLKSWATSKLPTLKAHLTQAEEIEEAVK